MLAPCYGSFGTTYRSHLRVSCSHADWTNTLSQNVWMLDPRRLDQYVVPKRRNAWPSKMGPIRCPETSATSYQYTLCKSAEEWKSHLHCDGSLKPRITSLMTRGAPVDSRGSPLRCTGVICVILTQCFLGTLQKRLLTYTSTLWCHGCHTFAL
jgi:hypothetical protein